MDEITHKKESLIVIKKSTLKIAVLILVAFVVGIMFDKGITGFFIAPVNQENKTQPTQQPIQPTQQPSQPTQQPSQEPTVQVSVDDDPSKGPANAKVTIIEFSDFQCPYCSRGATTIKQVIETYPNDVKVVFRDFPLSFHQNAQKAAEASECAHEQEKFWEMHDKLFANQQALDIPSLKQYAKDIGLDSTKFDSCLDSGKYTSEVQKDLREGQNAGVSGTPAFFIGDPTKGYQKVVGAQPFETFKQIIDSLLG